MELSTYPRSDEAKNILNRLLSYTRDMVIRRNFHFTLEEFYPKDKKLYGLNINRQIIKIRLRNSNDVNQFLVWDFILGTFIHELTHMLIHKHDATFYKKMDELHNEADDDNNEFLKNFKKQKYCSAVNTRILGGNKKTSKLLEPSTFVNGGIHKLGGNKLINVSAKTMASMAALQRAENK